MAKKDKYEDLTESFLTLIGGKENMVHLTHCMTRLRVNVKDKSLVQTEEIKNTEGVVGTQWSGEQLQIIIGTEVSNVYSSICRKGEIKAEEQINENLDGNISTLTIKNAGMKILDYLSGCMVPLIPILMGAGFFKTLQVVLSSGMLGVLEDGNDFLVFCDMVYNTLFYFIPIYLGYTASKKINLEISIGMMLGGILLLPTFMSLENFSLFGIYVPINDYSQSVFPVILSVLAAKGIYMVLNKYIPKVLSAAFLPFLTLLITLPLELCFIAPLGSNMGYLLQGVFDFLNNNAGILSVAIVSAVWQLLVMTGMHVVLIQFGMINLMTNGVDNVTFLGGNISFWATLGIAFGAFLYLKKESKTQAFSFFTAGILGGISEPALYGVAFRYKKPFIGLIVGGICGGIYAGLTHVGYYPGAGAGFLNLMAFIGGGTVNMINGCIACLIAFAVAAGVTYYLGEKEKK